MIVSRGFVVECDACGAATDRQPYWLLPCSTPESARWRSTHVGWVVTGPQSDRCPQCAEGPQR